MPNYSRKHFSKQNHTLKGWIIGAGFKIKDVAEKIGLPPNALTAIISGVATPSQDEIAGIASILEKTEDEIRDTFPVWH